MLSEDDCPTRGIGPQGGEEGCVEGDEGGAIRVPEIEHEHVAIGLLGRRTGAEGQAHLSPGGPDAEEKHEKGAAERGAVGTDGHARRKLRTNGAEKNLAEVTGSRLDR